MLTSPQPCRYCVFAPKNIAFAPPKGSFTLATTLLDSLYSCDGEFALFACTKQLADR